MKKAVVITGASGGLGLEYVKIFARRYAHLVLVARNEKKLQQIKKKLEERYAIDVQIFPQDLSKPDAAQNIYAFTEEKELQVEILVNNAGFGDFGRFASRDFTKLQEMMQVNMMALTELTHLYLPQMIEHHRGKILNIASIAAFEPGPMLAVYHASKAFVLSLSEALEVELKGTGVTVTALCPGPMATGFEHRAELEDGGLFKRMKVMDVKEVAYCGYRALMRNQTVVVPGVSNKLLVSAVRFAPRKLVRELAYRLEA